MKTIACMIMTMVLCAVSAMGAHRQVDSQEVPEAAKSGFTKMHPEVKDPVWEVKEDKYSASFKDGGKTVAVVFDSEGNFLCTQTEVKRKELPVIVAAGLESTEYSAWKIVAATFIETAERRNYYELTVQQSKQSVVLMFDKDGNLMSK